MNLLFIGDIVGSGGREAVKTLVPELRRELNIQFVIANAENSAGGNGLTGKIIRELSDTVDVFTAGDHVWDQKGFDLDVPGLTNFVRPANLSDRQPGKGFGIFRNPAGGDVAVISLLGKTFMRESSYCPFERVEQILKTIPGTCKNIFVDFHAEATSEKLAMGYFLEGKVTGVFGTHTHVPTADAVILPGGTAYQTDVGMVGADRSVLGRDVEDVLKKFTVGMPCRLNVVESGIIRLDAVMVTYDYLTGRASAVTPVTRKTDVK